MRDWQSRLARSTPFYYGWVVFGAAVGVGYSSRAVMAVATMSVFVVPMTQEFGWSRGFFSGAVSLGGLVAVVVSPWAGRVIDRLGSGVVIAAASAVSGLGCFGLAFVGQPWAFYSLYVPARAAFAGPLELGTATAISNWFIRRRPLALTLLMIFQGTGLAVLPLAAQFIIEGWGWRTSWAVLGIYGLVLGAAPALLLIVRRPEDVGLAADPEERRETPRIPVEAGLGEGAAGAGAVLETVGRRGVAGEVNFTVAEARRTRAFWLLAAFSAAGFMVQAGVSLHQVPHFINQGMPAGAAALTAGGVCHRADFGGHHLGDVGAAGAAKVFAVGGGVHGSGGDHRDCGVGVVGVGDFGGVGVGGGGGGLSSAAADGLRRLLRAAEFGEHPGIDDWGADWWAGGGAGDSGGVV